MPDLDLAINLLGHGSVGKREAAFTNLLDLRKTHRDPQVIAKLAADMKADPDTVKDGPDPEENLQVPAGYTYLGQFVDHDLTFDSTSSLDSSSSSSPSNLRTPRFDLDCLYGDGPEAQPYLYDPTGTKLLFKDGPVNPSAKPDDPAARDLFRNPNGRAIIGDKRNDENTIVSSIHLGFVKFHNAVVDALGKVKPAQWNTPSSLFASARNEVRWAYQKLLVEDFLPRIIHAEVLADLAHKTPDQRAKSYALYTEDLRSNLPREFVAAAYRFGHSGVRTGYRLNANTDPTAAVGNKRGGRFSIFPASSDSTTMAGSSSLLGFDPVPVNQVIDSWERFFPLTLPGVFDEAHHKPAAGDSENTAVRLQFAYKIDPTLIDPLGVLPRQEVAGEATAEQAEKEIAPAKLPDTTVKPPRPSLGLLNLLRGEKYLIQGGQAFAAALKAKGLPCKPLEPKHLAIRRPGSKDKTFVFQQIAPALVADTPLWFYILAEAQAPLVDQFGTAQFSEDQLLTGVGAKTQLGWVGGRIVAEVFYGLLDADDESYVNAAPKGWQPIFAAAAVPLVFRSLLHFADSTNA